MFIDNALSKSDERNIYNQVMSNTEIASKKPSNQAACKIYP